MVHLAHHPMYSCMYSHHVDVSAAVVWLKVHVKTSIAITLFFAECVCVSVSVNVNVGVREGNTQHIVV